MSQHLLYHLIETDDGKEFVNKDFNEYLKLNKITRYSRYTSHCAVFAERFNRTLRNFLKKPVFLKGNANWIDELQSIVKKHNETNTKVSKY